MSGDMKECNEIWKDVKGYEGLYQVSNRGNVKSLDRLIYHKNRSTPNRVKCMLHIEDGLKRELIIYRR